MSDLISREEAIRRYCADECRCDPEGCNGAEDCSCIRLLKSLPSVQRWIPCSERLPEEDVEVLISYRYKEGDGYTSYTDIDITTYGQMYFGGNKVGNHKHWRQPFEYFASNCEVVAWMPLPEPYGKRREQNG